MIKRKKKICIKCRKERYIFSKGRCMSCAKREYKSLNKRKQNIYSENSIHTKVLKDCDNKCFFNPCIKFYSTTISNFMHVLPKGRYKYFKFYHKNIVLGLIEHHILEELSNLDKISGIRNIVKRVQAYPNEREGWKNYLKLRAELKIEYRYWIKYHKGEYKI